MRSLEHMIDRATQICGSKSAVAETLGDSPQTLYNYERGLRHMPAAKVMRLATLANLNAMVELGRYEAEWVQKKSGRAAAGIAVAAFSLGAWFGAPGSAEASQAPGYAICTLCALLLVQTMVARRWPGVRSEKR